MQKNKEVKEMATLNTSHDSKHQFRKKISFDISEVEALKTDFEKNNIEEKKIKDFIEEITLAYNPYIHDLFKSTNYYREMYQYHECTKEDLMMDLKLIIRKLDLFESDNCTPTQLYENGTSSIHVTNSNHNSNTNTITIDISTVFNELRKEIETMGYLPFSEIENIKEKINEIEEICTNNDSRPVKWNKLKSTFDWLTTKGVDIGIKLLPIIAKALSE
jgi:hypothetical protein